MKCIKLTKGFATRVSELGYEKVKGFEWSSLKVGRRIYAVRGEGGQKIYMHRVIMEAPKGLQVDHVDGDGLNNVESNLRLVTHTQNSQSFCRKRVGATSRFRGVSWDEKNKKWRASIRAFGRTRNLGRFESEEKASQAYGVAATVLFGGFHK